MSTVLNIHIVKICQRPPTVLCVCLDWHRQIYSIIIQVYTCACAYKPTVPLYYVTVYTYTSTRSPGSFPIPHNNYIAVIICYCRCVSAWLPKRSSAYAWSTLLKFSVFNIRKVTPLLCSQYRVLDLPLRPTSLCLSIKYQHGKIIHYHCPTRNYFVLSAMQIISRAGISLHVYPKYFSYHAQS